MNNYPFISFIMVFGFLLSMTNTGIGETTKTALTVKNISFQSLPDGMERLTLLCNQACLPELFTIEGESPRLVMDLKEVLLVQAKLPNIRTQEGSIKKVRSYLNKQTKIWRVVLDMDPAKHYIVHPLRNPSGNTFTLMIKDDSDSPLSQEKRLAILRPDPSPAEREGKLRQASSGEGEPGVMETITGSSPWDEGKSQLNEGDYAAAIDTFTGILVAHPQDSLAYRLRGNAHDNLGDRPKAIEDWTQAARLGDTKLQSYLDFLQIKWRGNPAP